MSRLIGTARMLPGIVVGTTFQAAKLPLRAAARTTGQGDNKDWTPLLLVEGAEAAVETTFGALLRDDSLVSRGRLRQARLRKLREAARLETAAERKRVRADDELEERREAAERRRDEAGQTAERREREIEKKTTTRKQSAKKTAAAREQAVSTQAAATEAALDREEREGKLAATDAENAALEKERAALAAEDKALAADEAIDASRDARAGS